MMMGAANLITTGAKQIDVSLPPSEHEEANGISFAQSFEDGMKAEESLPSENLLKDATELGQGKIKAHTLADAAANGKPGFGGTSLAGAVRGKIEVQSMEAKSSPAFAKATAGAVVKDSGAEGNSALTDNSIEDVQTEANGSALLKKADVGSTANTTPGKLLGDAKAKEIGNAAGVPESKTAKKSATADQPGTLEGKGAVILKNKPTAEKTEEARLAKGKKSDKNEISVGTNSGGEMSGSALGSIRDTGYASPGSIGQSGVAISDSSGGGWIDGVIKDAGGREEAVLTAGKTSLVGTGTSQSHTIAPGDAAKTPEDQPAAGASTTFAEASPVSTGTEKSNAVSLAASADAAGKVQGAVVSSVQTIVHAPGALGDAGPGAIVPSVAHVHGATDINVPKLQAEGTSPQSAHPLTGNEEMNGFGEGGVSADAPHMLSATPTALEVGIQNGTHGWLKVRAEIADGGAVSASVSTASSTAQEMLHRELPALTAYLQQEKVAVSAVVIHASASPGTGIQNSSHESGGGQAQQGGEGGQRQQRTPETGAPGTKEASGYADSIAGIQDEVRTTGIYSAGGGWLSVRA